MQMLYLVLKLEKIRCILVDIGTVRHTVQKPKECYDGKTYISITDMFRSYDTVVDAVGDYYDMLGSCSRYEKCIGMTDAKQCITAIKNGGYATSPTLH